MKSDKNIREGYKKTAVGVIPEEWEVKKLKELVTIQNGRGYSHLEKGDIPVYASGGIINYVNKPLYEGTSIGIGRKGTIDSPQLLTGKYWVIDTLFFMNDFKDVYPYFLYSKFQEVNWYRYNETSGLPSLIKNTIQKVQFAIPPLPEQQAIANCLTTWDSGIEKLTQLIAAKREQKKGLMQQLLTGKKRLDGFVGEGEEVKIDKLAEIFRGKGLSKSVLDENGKNKCILYGELYTTYEEVIDKVHLRTDSEDGFVSEKFDILIPSSTTTRGIDLVTASCLMESNVLLGGDMIVVRPKLDKINPIFFAYLFSNTLKKDVLGYTQGVTIIHLYGKDLKEVLIKKPSLKEQTAIAHILTTADQEIALLEKKLEAMKEEKKGLMQVLLTGKKRLIDS